MSTSRTSRLRRLDETGLLLLAARLFVGVTFMVMGANKIADPIAFLKSLRLYGVLPETPGVYLNVTAIVVPWVEVVCGVALVIGLRVRGAALAIALMLAVFTPAVLVRTADIMRTEGKPFFEVAFDCGCGTGVEIIWRKVIMNATLFLFAVVALLSHSRRFCAAMWFERRRPDPTFCHFCGYKMRSSRAGLCESCAERPVLPDPTPQSAG